MKPPQIWIVHEAVAYMVIERRIGNQTLVLASPEDVPKFEKFRWTIDGGGYAVTDVVKNGIAAFVQMHVMVLRDADHLETDHVNGNRCDNRRNNLRLCTHQQNTWNTKLRENTEVPFKGVSLRKDKTAKRYRANLVMDGRKFELGSYLTAEEAARAYDDKAKEMFGQYARTNESLGLFNRRFGKILAMGARSDQVK